MKRRWFLATGLVSAGCSVLPTQPYQQRRDWPLLPKREAVLTPRRGGPVLLIRTMTAGPGLDARGIQWLRPDGSLNVDYYEQWASQPAQAMEEGLRQWLRDSGLFAGVVAPGSRANPDLVLETELTALAADPKAGTARASLTLLLLEPRGETARVRLQSAITAEAPLAGAEVGAIVAALRQAAETALRKAETALSGALIPIKGHPG